MQHRFRLPIVLLLVLSLLLTACCLASCEDAPGDPTESTAGTADTEPTDLSVFAGKSAVILRANPDGGQSAPLASRLSDAGTEVKILTFADLAQGGADFSAADLLILDSEDLYYAPAEDAYRAYFESGKPVLAIGDDPLGKPAVLANGRYQSVADLLRASEALEDFASDSLDDYEITGNPVSTYPAEYILSDAGSGFGRSLYINTGIERQEASLTLHPDLSGKNALVFCGRISTGSNQMSVMLEQDDGSHWYAFVKDDRPEKVFQPFLLGSEDFRRIPYEQAEEPVDFSFDRVVSVKIGMIRMLHTGMLGRIGTNFEIGRIAACTIEERDTDTASVTRDENDLRHILFPNSYAGFHAEETGCASDRDDGIGMLSESVFTLRLRGNADEGLLSGVIPLRTLKNGRTDATQLLTFAWAEQTSSGARRAAIGTADRAYWEACGTDDAFSLASALLSADREFASPDSYLVKKEAVKSLRISTIGDSITFGSGSTNGNSYPAQLGRAKGPLDLTVTNFGIGGTAAMRNLSFPYRTCEAYLPSLEAEADYVIFMFGANDIREWENGGREVSPAEYEELVLEYLNLPCKPKVVLGLTIPRNDFDSYNIDLRNGFRDLVLQVADKYDLPVIDFYPLLVGQCNDYYSENIHPDDIGYGYLAEIVYDKLCELEGLSQ